MGESLDESLAESLDESVDETDLSFVNFLDSLQSYRERSEITIRERAMIERKYARKYAKKSKMDALKKMLRFSKIVVRRVR